MKLTTNRLLAVLFAGMFLHAGCATQEVVKHDPPLAPSAATPAETAQARPVIQPSPTQNKQAAAPAPAPKAPGSNEQKKLPPAPEPSSRADVRTALQAIYFDFNAATLSEAARRTLAKNFGTLKKIPQARVRVEGHCDERGSDEYNLALGERRAQAAARYLTTLGMPANKLTTISYGKEKPADPGHDEAAWSRNRRDEFVVRD